MKNCTCLPGYHGDGYVCDPVNPCQIDNGGCPDQSTRCINDSPGKVIARNCVLYTGKYRGGGGGRGRILFA